VLGRGRLAWRRWAIGAWGSSFGRYRGRIVVEVDHGWGELLWCWGHPSAAVVRSDEVSGGNVRYIWLAPPQPGGLLATSAALFEVLSGVLGAGKRL
jgi:hypothetical protein